MGEGVGTNAQRGSPWPSNRIMLRLAAACAFLTAFTTLLLWWLPQTYASPATFEDGVRLASNPAYMGRLWVNFVHVFLALAAYGAAAALLARGSPALAWVGLVAMILWAFSEALGVAVNIWGQNVAWRGSYAAADPPTQAMIRAALLVFQGVWDGIFFVVLVCFAFGSLAFGLAALRGAGLERALGLLFLLAVPLTVIIMLDGYFGSHLSVWISWVYPVLQPVSRAVLAFWLWREARN